MHRSRFSVWNHVCKFPPACGVSLTRVSGISIPFLLGQGSLLCLRLMQNKRFCRCLTERFFWLELASGFGAVIGLMKTTASTLWTIENRPAIGGMILLINMVIVMFTNCLQSTHHVTSHVRTPLTDTIARQFAKPVSYESGINRRLFFEKPDSFH